MQTWTSRGFAGALASLLLVVGAASAQKKGNPEPELVDVSYGPHERNVLDLWKAKSDAPTPLVIFIHGGGFARGDKSSIRKNSVVRQCLGADVSFASINYRFRDSAPIQDILRDAGRAVQFLRSKAKEYNLDPKRFAAYGGSAGAGTSLWLAFHDDLADPKASDPVLRESSRLAAAGSLNGQCSYDLRDWEKVLGKSQFQRSAVERLLFYGLKSPDGPEADHVMKDCSMLSLVSKDDPPVALACALPDGEIQNQGHYVHHPRHATSVADRCKQSGVDVLLLLTDDPSPDVRNQQQKQVVAFLIEKLTARN